MFPSASALFVWANWVSTLNCHSSSHYQSLRFKSKWQGYHCFGLDWTHLWHFPALSGAVAEARQADLAAPSKAWMPHRIEQAWIFLSFFFLGGHSKAWVEEMCKPCTLHNCRSCWLGAFESLWPRTKGWRTFPLPLAGCRVHTFKNMRVLLNGKQTTRARIYVYSFVCLSVCLHASRSGEQMGQYWLRSGESRHGAASVFRESASANSSVWRNDVMELVFYRKWLSPTVRPSACLSL